MAYSEIRAATRVATHGRPNPSKPSQPNPIGLVQLGQQLMYWEFAQFRNFNPRVARLQPSMPQIIHVNRGMCDLLVMASFQHATGSSLPIFLKRGKAFMSGRGHFCKRHVHFTMDRPWSMLWASLGYGKQQLSSLPFDWFGDVCALTFFRQALSCQLAGDRDKNG